MPRRPTGASIKLVSRGVFIRDALCRFICPSLREATRPRPQRDDHIFVAISGPEAITWLQSLPLVQARLFTSYKSRGSLTIVCLSLSQLYDDDEETASLYTVLKPFLPGSSDYVATAHMPSSERHEG